MFPDRSEPMTDAQFSMGFLQRQQEQAIEQDRLRHQPSFLRKEPSQPAGDGLDLASIVKTLRVWFGK